MLEKGLSWEGETGRTSLMGRMKWVNWLSVEESGEDCPSRGEEDETIG